jgi:predicted metal-binding protein
MNKNNKKLKALIQDAQQSGASEAKIISARDIVVDHHLADMCREPRCENYGLSKSCPPQVSGPFVFKQVLEKFNQAIFFKIDVPSEVLYSGERREVFQLLHEIASGVETSADKWDLWMLRPMQAVHAKKYFAMTTGNVWRFLKRENAEILSMQDLRCPDSASMWQSCLKQPNGR